MKALQKSETHLCNKTVIEGENLCSVKIFKKSAILRTGFVHFFRPKIQGLFKDFPGPYFETSRTFFSKNLPQTKQNVCV